MSVNVLSSGLVGNYYSNSTFSGNPIVALSPNIDYPDLRASGMPPGIPTSNLTTDLFSIVWTGFIVPSFTETFTFSSYNDDSLRLFINGQQIMYSLYSPTSGAPAVSSPVNLTAGVAYPIRVEYTETGYDAYARLMWSSSSVGSNVTIPAANFRASLSTPTTQINGGSVKTSGVQYFGPSVFLGADTTLTSTGSGDITLGETVDGAKNLIINTSGKTTFGGTVGFTTALTSLTTDGGGTTAINTTNIITTGSQIYGDNVTLGNNPLLQTTAGGNISFAGSIQNFGSTKQNLNLDSGSSGTISIVGAVGSASPNQLGFLGINNSGGSTFQSSVNADIVAIDGTKAGQTVEFQGNLTAGTLATVSSPYNVAIKGSNNSINSATTFLNTGTVTLGNEAADVTFFGGSLSTAVASTTNTGGIIRTPGAAITINKLNALANTTLDSTNNGANPAGADVTITNGSNLNGFKVDTLGGTSGSTNVTGNTTINAGQMIITSGNLNLGTAGATVTTSGNTLIKVMTGSLNLTSNTTLATGTDTITLQADTININTGSTITGTTSTLILTPTTATRDIYVGDAATGQLNSLQLPQSSITPITVGTLVIGSPGNTGIMTIGATSLDDKARFVANGGGGKFVVSGTITSTVAAGAGVVGVQFIGSGSTTVLNADIITSGTAIQILDAVQVDAANVSLNTTSGGATAGANVLITGGTSGIFATAGETTNNLTINAGTGGTALLGSLRGFGTGGGTGDLVNNLTVVNAATTSLPSVNVLAGTVGITSTNITLGADLTAGSTTANGSLTLTGAVALTSSVVLAGDGITVSGGITGNNYNLTFDGNGGASSANGAVSVSGAISDIQGLTVQDANGATFAAVTAQTVQLSNTNTGTVTFGGNLAVAGQFAAATGSNYNLEIIGTTNTIGGPVSFINTGSMTLGNDNSDSTTIGSGVSRSAQTFLQGTVNFGGATTLGSAEATKTTNSNLTLSADSLSLTHNGGNAFAAVSITTTNATVFAGGTLAATTLAVNAGSISQTGNGVLAPTGAATLTATGTIALGGSNTFGGDVTVSGTSVTLNDNSALSLAGTNTVTGNLVLTSTGGISQTGGSVVAVTGSSTLSSTGQDITLSNAGNAFTGPVGFTGANVALRTNGALALAASTATGTLDATANG
ncbi:MAG: beta strand repeat-containing protein, partial [Planctomycetota bacterium]